MNTATRSIPHCNSVKVYTGVIDLEVHELEYASDGLTEIDLNNGQLSIEFYNDGTVGIDAGIPEAYVKYDSFEDFVDVVLRGGGRV